MLMMYYLGSQARLFANNSVLKQKLSEKFLFHPSLILHGVMNTKATIFPRIMEWIQFTNQGTNVWEFIILLNF